VDHQGEIDESLRNQDNAATRRRPRLLQFLAHEKELGGGESDVGGENGYGRESESASASANGQEWIDDEGAHEISLSLGHH